MNYYEHHLGDYMRDTVHLSLLEDGAYRRLLDAYYVRERPLPADLRDCCKLARAVSKAERDAVAYVLREFFVLAEDGYHQRRADAEIERFRGKSDKARASVNARWDRTRTAGGTNHERNTNASKGGHERNADGIHRAPVPSHQSPITSKESTTVLSARAPAPDPWLPVPTDDPQEPSGKALPKQEQERGGTAALTPPPDQPPPRPSAAAQVCIALRAAGVADVNPGHPRLQTLLEAGATAAEFVGFVEKARAAAPGREFAYVLGAVEGARTRAAAAAPGLHRGPMPATGPRQTAVERQIATMNALTGRDRRHAAAADAVTFADTIDVDARLVR